MGQGKIEMEEETVRDVRKFLGLANYYRQFVKDFVKLAQLLNNLTRKEEK